MAYKKCCRNVSYVNFLGAAVVSVSTPVIMQWLGICLSSS